MNSGPQQVSHASAHVPGTPNFVLLNLAFLAVAATLRAIFLDFGLPYIYHPDEPINLAIIQRILVHADPNPHFFNYPSLFFYINLPGQYFVEWKEGILASFAMQSMGNGLTVQPEAFEAGRLTTLLFGLAVLPILLIWARTLRLGMSALLVLGVLFCLQPLLLRESTWITPDTFAAFFTTVALLGSSSIVFRGDRSAYLIAAVMAGLAASAKYNAGLVFVAIVAGHIVREGLSIHKVRPLVEAAAVTGLIFVLSSPFVALDPVSAVRDIVFELRHYRNGHPGSEGDSLAVNATWMFNNFGLAGLLAILSCFSSRARALLPSIFFVIAYFFLLSVQYVHFERNLLPVIPAILFLMAAGLDAIIRKIAKALPNAAPIAAAIVPTVALGLFAMPAMVSVKEIVRYSADPRAEARSWANSLLPHTPAARTAVEPYAPYVFEQGRSVTQVGLVGDMDSGALAPFSYVVVSRAGSGRFLHGPYERQRANLAALAARSCDRHDFPAGRTEPDYTIFVLACD